MPGPPVRRVLPALLLVTMLLTLSGTSAHAVSNLPQTAATIVVDGQVNAIVVSGTTVVVGGVFSRAGSYSGGFASAPTAGGTPASLPAVGGTVNAVAPDGSGGWFVGGSFSTVGAVARSNLVHITSAGAVDAAWNPSPDGAVNALVLSADRSTLYVGGAFATIGGQTRNSIAALSPSTGSATSWNPNGNGTISALALSPDGATVYAGGIFTAIGGQSRIDLAALDAGSGATSVSWNPAPGNLVDTLAVSPDGTTVYAGGTFLNIGGSARNRIAALSATTGVATSWNPNAGAAVNDLAVSPDGATVYAGGAFGAIGGAARSNVASLSAATGSATSWDPSSNGTVVTISLSTDGSTVYLGGLFTAVGGQSRNDVAALAASSGVATSWQEDADGQVNALAVTSSAVGIGGTLSAVGMQARGGLAAFDSSSGQLAPWNANANAAVSALALSPDGSTLFAGGLFTSIGGQTRNRIASLQLATGLLTSWNPNANATVSALAVAVDGTVYAGGSFTTVAGLTRNRIAAIDATGTPTAWDPNASNTVTALAVSGTTVYAGGTFATIGGQARTDIAALDAAVNTNSATAWNPAANGAVNAIQVSGATVYAGGAFTTIGGQTRNRLAALDAASAAATAWNPNANNTVDAIALSGSSVYAGGLFTTIGGQTRNRLAALDATSAAATTWNPNASSTGTALAFAGSTLYAGGAWTTIGPTVARLPFFAGFHLDAPVNATAPAVTGSPAGGQTLSCTTGTWTNAPTGFAYAWLRDGSAIGGATSSTYVVVSGDLGHQLACRVTASNGEGSGIATSAVVTAVGVPANTAAPMISGSATVGATLACDAGTWTYSASFAYQWLRDGGTVAGATSATYATGPDDSGHAVACRVTATNAAGSVAATSAGVAVIAVAPIGGGVKPPGGQTPTQTTAQGLPGVAGSFTVGDATISWPTTAFAAPTTITVQASVLAAPVDGFAQGSLILTVTLGSNAPAVLPAPLVIHFPKSAVSRATVPASSVDAVSWTPMLPLSSESLPDGRLEGAFIRTDGSLDLLVRGRGSYVGLLTDEQPPSGPAMLSGSVRFRALALRWPPASDNSRRIGAYQLLREAKVIARVAGTKTAAAVRVRAGSYSVRAIDPAGKVGATSKPLVIRAVKPPAGLPRTIPGWAPRLLGWQLLPAATRGARPGAPAHLPSWFWTWRAWQVHAFTVGG